MYRLIAYTIRYKGVRITIYFQYLAIVDEYYDSKCKSVFIVTFCNNTLIVHIIIIMCCEISQIL